MRRLFTGILMCLTLCSGCVSLPEISRYAKLASDAAANGVLSADYRDSEVRRKALLERTAALSREGGAGSGSTTCSTWRSCPARSSNAWSRASGRC